MPSITVVFTRRRALGSVLIRAWMHSRFSHCALVDTEAQTVIEATARRGVIERPLAELLAESSYHETVRIPCRAPALALLTARREVGKPYDWRGVLGFWVRRDWNRGNAWFCSELIAGVLERIGESAFRRSPHRVSPEQLYLPRFDRLDAAGQGSGASSP